MTIFSGVVAILSPSLVSRLPTYNTDKTSKGPLALGAVLERLQLECGVSCSRTAENVCMVQGEWDAIRKAYSFLDHHNALNSMCRPNKDDSSSHPPPPPPPLAPAPHFPSQATKKARPDKSPEDQEGEVTPPTGPLSAISFSPSLKYRLSAHIAPQGDDSCCPIAGARGGGVLPTTTGNNTAMAAASNNAASPGNHNNNTRSSPSQSGGGRGENATHNKGQKTTTTTTTQGKSGAMKRKQGMPRKQLQNIGTPSMAPSCPSSSPHSDEDEDILDIKPMSQHDQPTFANGDSSIQIVAAWGNFKEEPMGGEEGEEEVVQPKEENTGGEGEQGENRRFVYYQDVEKETAGGTGVYTVESDGQGGTVILPTFTEPVYVLNVKDDQYVPHTYNDNLKQATRKTTVTTAARKSATNRLPASRKSTSARTLLLLSKKVGPQKAGGGNCGGNKKGGGNKLASSSPQRRRGIIQGDSPIKGEFTCSYCQKVFNTKEAIHVHEEVYHTGRYKSLPSSSKSPLFECNQCGKSYMSKHALEEHLYTHVGMRPFACPFCAASFNHRKSLRRHVQLHNNVKRFDCSQCSKTFVRKDALESHLRVHKTEMDVDDDVINDDVSLNSPGQVAEK